MKGKILIALLFLSAACVDDPVDPQKVFDKRLQKDILIIDQYLADHGITDAIKDASGVRIVIHTLGTLGLPPVAGNNIIADYAGRLLSTGAEFDSGTVDGQLSDWITGWQIGLAMLPEGTVATLYIPSGWAYGTSARTGIPANSILIFDIDLTSVSPTTTQASKRTMDIADIDEYLTANQITALTHDSGLRYVITQEGTGSIPALYDQVKVSIKGKLLSNNTQFLNVVGSPSATFSSRVANYLQGIMVGLQQMKVGGKATLYVPSGMAYGTQAYSDLPANSNVIFELELQEVIQ